MRWVGLKTLVARECTVIGRYWSVTLAPPVITTFLYFTIFGEIFEDRMGSVDDVGYVQYLAPGLIVLWVIPYSFGHTAAGLSGARHFRYIEEVLVSPLPRWIVMLGHVIGGMIRGLVVALAAVVTAALFTPLSFHSLPVSLAALLLAALVSAAAGLVAAIWAKTFEQVTAIQVLILTPLTYVGGVFTSIAGLPEWAQKLSLVNPMFYMVNAFRYGMLGVSDVSVGVAILTVSVFAAVLVVIAMLLMGRLTAA